MDCTVEWDYGIVCTSQMFSFCFVVLWVIFAESFAQRILSQLIMFCSIAGILFVDRWSCQSLRVLWHPRSRSSFSSAYRPDSRWPLGYSSFAIPLFFDNHKFVICGGVGQVHATCACVMGIAVTGMHYTGMQVVPNSIPTIILSSGYAFFLWILLNLLYRRRAIIPIQQRRFRRLSTDQEFLQQFSCRFS